MTTFLGFIRVTPRGPENPPPSDVRIVIEVIIAIGLVAFIAGLWFFGPPRGSEPAKKPLGQPAVTEQSKPEIWSGKQY